MDTLHIWVGTDKFQYVAGAELTLAYSIRKHASIPVEIHWMRAGDPEDWRVSERPTPGHWNLGRPIDLAWPKKGAGTPFSPFRFAVPEKMQFQGRAVYLDADMLVLGDVAELASHKLTAGYNCCHVSRTDVSVIDCEWFKDVSWWPSIEKMQGGSGRVFDFLSFMVPKGAVAGNLGWEWNDCDGQRYCRDAKSVKLAHFTDVRTQPYRPYPTVPYIYKKFPYHPNTDLGTLWWSYYKEALVEKYGREGERLWYEDAHREVGK